MFIHAGRKTKRTDLGDVADYCRRCGGIRRFSLRELRRVWHIYGVSLGAGTPAGHEVACQGCKAVSPASAASYAGTVRGVKAGSMDQLIAATNPDIEHEVAAIQELQERAKGGGLDGESRRVVIAEHIMAFAHDVQKRTLTTHMDFWSGLAFTLTFLLFVATCFAAAVINRIDALAQAGLIVGALIGLAVSIALITTDVRRYLARRVYGPLAERLTPVRPGEQELRDALAIVSASGWKIGSRIQVGALVNAISSRSR